MKNKKQTTKQISLDTNNRQEIDIDITPEGLQTLSEALNFNSIDLREGDVVEVNIDGISKITVLRFKIVSPEISMDELRKICDKYLAQFNKGRQLK